MKHERWEQIGGMNELKRRTEALIMLYVSVEGGKESLIDLFLVSCEKELKITTHSFSCISQNCFHLRCERCD